MAVILDPNYSRCQVRLQTGVDNNGDPILVSRTYGRIRPAATHQDVYDVISALMGLQNFSVYAIRRLEDGELINQE
ncbi:MAG TPA: DUF1659 domain-containing protein [Firmicutes bacterium]|nr:DUF1659 domain-containing protein [Bacillota bacterium]